MTLLIAMIPLGVLMLCGILHPRTLGPAVSLMCIILAAVGLFSLLLIILGRR